jgi:hypothetical protein
MLRAGITGHERSECKKRKMVDSLVGSSRSFLKYKANLAEP